MKTRKQEPRKSDRTSVGEKISRTLRKARIDKHYSLDDLHRITKIKVSYLKDIDTGDFKKVPEGFYLRAFIKKYADTVGLDGTELLKRYNNELPDLQDPRFIDKVSEDKLLIRAAKQRVQTRHSAVLKYIPLVVIMMVVFFILVGIWAVASRSHSHLTANYHDHSTSVSGESSLKRVKHHKKRKHHVKRHRITIKKGAKQGQSLVYNVKTKVSPLRMKLDSSSQIKFVVKDDQKVLKQSLLKPNQKKLMKLSKRDKLIQLNLTPQDKVKLQLNHKVKQLNSKRSAQSIILKFSK